MKTTRARHMALLDQPPAAHEAVVGVQRADALGVPRHEPGGERPALPTDLLQRLVDQLIEASSTALAVDWTDVESFARPPSEQGGATADPEGSWGHRRGDSLGQRDELFYGFYFGLATMVCEERGPAVPELVRRALLTSCHVDPVPAFVAVLENMVDTGVPLGDVLNDSGYSPSRTMAPPVEGRSICGRR